MMKKNNANNPAALLSGEWRTMISNASFLDDPEQTITGHATFKWFGNKTFLVMRSRTISGGPPESVAILNLDDSTQEGAMIYYDERGVSRVYQMSIKGNKWKLWRKVPGFSQKFEGTISRNKKIIRAAWYTMEKRTWRHDFDIVYQRK